MKTFIQIALIISYSCITASYKAPTILASFNVDTNIFMTEEGYARDAYPQWRANARMPLIVDTCDKIIQKHQPDVILIQEAREFVNKFGEKIDSLNPIISFLKSQNYTVQSHKYTPTELSFSYITAIKDTYTLQGNDVLYLTKTPSQPTNHTLSDEERKENNFGEKWERSSFITHFSDNNAQKYIVFNVHLSMGLEHRTKACALLRTQAEKYIKENPNVKVIIAGDFNSFSDRGGPEQLAIMTEGDLLKEATKPLTLVNGQEVHDTFIAFPYDFAQNTNRLKLGSILAAMNTDDRREKIKTTFQNECTALCDHLDRGFSYGFDFARAFLIPAATYNDFDNNSFNEQTVKEYIMRHHNDGPAFASDHQPNVLELK